MTMTPLRRRMLFIGDFACTTGFGTVNEALLSRVPEDQWNIYIIGINATGDPHPLNSRFKIYPAGLHGNDVFGVNRTASLCPAIKPDLVVIHQDSWNVPGYLDAIRQFTNDPPPIIAWCPADSPNQWTAGQMMPDVDLVLAPTRWGADELARGGYKGRTEVLSYGVDTDLFKPADRRQARQAIGFPEALLDDIVFGRADRNASRKRYDLTIKHFAQWWHSVGRPENARLLFHCSSNDPAGWNFSQLADYYGLDDGRIILTAEGLMPNVLWPRHRLPLVYQAMDVHVSTTQGEGFGLVSVESAACGIPQMLPRYSALGDLFVQDHVDHACFMRCTGEVATVGGINTIGGIVDGGDLEWTFNHLYEDAVARERYGALALKTALRPEFQWETIAEKFLTLCEEVVRGK